MDNLYENQVEIAEAMDKLFINFKKDSKERKTENYFKKRLQTLDLYWSEYQNNHSKLRELNDLSHPYFINSEFESVRQKYQHIKLFIKEQYQESIEQSKESNPTYNESQASTSSVGQRVEEKFIKSIESRGAYSKLDEMLRKQFINFKAFLRTVNNINIELITEKWEFDDILRQLQNRWSLIDSLHWEIDAELNGEDEEYDMTFSKHEKTFQSIKRSLNNKLWSVSHKEQYTPKMDIPIFNGNYQQWVAFKNLFTEAIHTNACISNSQKMQFLKSKVQGEPEKLIQHLSISSENYATCWDILNHRYDNKKRIFTSHINSLLGIPVAQQQSLMHIKKLHDTTLECTNAIKNLGLDISTWDPILVHILALKMDTDTYMGYNESLKNPRDLPTLKEFLDYLEGKFTSLESSRKKQESSSLHHNQQASNSLSSYKFNHNKNHSSFKPNQHTTKPFKSLYLSSINCPLCKESHGIFHCKKFIDMPIQAKHKIVEQYRLCKNCLHNHHGNNCFSHKRCRICNGNHNTILHNVNIKSAKINKRNSEIEQCTSVLEQKNNINNDLQVTHTNNLNEILLSTAKVKVTSTDGSCYVMRALIDQGSQISIITENAAQLLNLKRSSCKGIIFSVGEKESKGKGMSTLSFCSMYNDSPITTNVYIMTNLIKNLPNSTFSKPSWPHIQNIKLADPEFYISSPIDILLGADVYATILQEGIIRGEESQPIAQQTQLGWILCGSIKSFQCNVTLNNLDSIQKFWEIEDIMESSSLSSEDLQCINYYKTTTKRLDNGKYVVRLPLKADIETNLGSSKQVAIAQFKNLERKFSRNHKFSCDYKSFINEYINLNHMRLCNKENNIFECYLPHHGVERMDSITTKLRVVFNASAKTSNGTCLNDFMYRGPNLQQDLQSIILKWRKFQFVFTADIEKMYRNILLHEEDQKYQKIIWREEPYHQLQEFKLLTVTYGTKVAPFLAIMTLKQLASDERNSYPEAANILENDSYVDDILSGAYDLEQGKKLIESLDLLLKSGGFLLRKWSSNKLQLLEKIDEEHKLNIKNNIFNFKSENIKTLGLFWNPTSDKFCFKCNIGKNSISKPTKRVLLSEISKIFDPLGWLAPIITKLKLLFQKVWDINIDWDSIVTKEILTEWILIRSDISNINNIEISRWLGSKQGDIIELHGFCDSSLKAYACAIYARIKQSSEHSVVLVAAKTKLVPSKKKNITLPKLELCGALLLSKLAEKVKNTLCDHNIRMYAWCDSMIVLGWLQGKPGRWNTFVANRVKTITNIIPQECWRYIKSEENPADAASRGLLASELQKNTLWWQGPHWLLSYDSSAFPFSTYNTEQELKLKQVCVVQNNSNDNIIHNLLHNYNSYNKIIRILAWVLRFIQRQCKLSNKFLTLHEVRHASRLIIKYIQCTEFALDMEQLIKNKTVASKSKILNLNPFLDSFGILRVGGRLRNANIHNDMKYPILIPQKSRLTELLINQAHLLTFHGGPRLTLSTLRQKFWIIGGNSATKKLIRNCVTCRKYDTRTSHQIMGNLPAARVKEALPFYHTGVDYTGYVEIKANKGRGIKTCKGYVALFICMVTKAIHLELVSDLSTSAFLAALRRMVARRGAPKHMYSDNGTNFVGANRILQAEYIDLQSLLGEDFQKQITDLNIEWHFNAPAWPSAVGIWERSVRSLKFHLKRVLGEQKLTFEEYSTLLARLEACLNSRPLCSLSENIDDLDVLTPQHFLSGRAGANIIDTAEDARSRWQLTNKLFHDTWNRWKSEYLTQLSVRSKWLKPQPNIKRDDLVVIQEKNLPPGKWLMGRVVDLHPGDDGRVRVVTLKTSSGIIKRPIIKLVTLPLKSNLDTENISPEQPPEYNDPTTTSKHAKTNFINKRSYYSSFITLFIMFMSFTLCTAESSYNITNLRNNQFLYFNPISNLRLSQDSWKLVVFYNMSPYWQGIKAYNQIKNHLQEICENIPSSTHCDITLLQLHHEYAELEYYNQLFLTQHMQLRTRRRRGLINGVGYIANSLFGVLDERFAEKYQQDIELLQHNNKHILNLLKNQTSLVEAEHNLLQRTEFIIEKQHKIVNKHINTIYGTLNTVKQELQNFSMIQEFTLSVITANNILQNLHRIQDSLLDIITDVHHGTFNVHLLTPEQLQRELNIISGHLSSDLALPIEDLHSELSELYKLLQVKARMTQQYMIFEISFPLVNKDTFMLYKLISIPRQVSNRMINITPIAEYVAINLKKDTYFTINEFEVQQCQKREKHYLCNYKTITYHLTSKEQFCQLNLDTHSCKTTISACHQKWTELNSQSYIYFVCNNYTVRIICDDQVYQVQLNSSGVIFLQQDCMIKGNDYTLFSHQVQTNSININPRVYSPTISKINNIINISIPIEELTVANFSHVNKTLDDLSLQIKTIKKNSQLLDSSVSEHDIHQYAVCYLLVAVVGLFGAVFLWRRCGRCRSTPITPIIQNSVSTNSVSEPIKQSKVDRQPSISVSVSDLECSRKQSKADRQPSESENIELKDIATSPIIRHKQSFII